MATAITPTPGPWFVSPEGRGRILIRASNHKTGSEFTALAQVMAGPVGDAQAYGNAYAMAAAPHLLAACKLARQVLKAIHDPADGDKEMTAAADAVDAAIARAEGKS